MYETTIRLGQSTTTYDAEGDIISEAPVPMMEEQALREHLRAFEGEISQVPPMFSAVKHQGRPLHRLARAGLEVERKARSITIFNIILEQWSPPDLVVRLTCSPGTYVRTLAHDLGMRLECGGHVTQLRRLASGTWHIEDAVTLPDFQTAGHDWQRYLHGLRGALSTLPSLILPADLAYRFALGQRIVLLDAPSAMELRVLDQRERLVGIGRYDAQTSLLAPHKVLADPQLFAP